MVTNLPPNIKERLAITRRLMLDACSLDMNMLEEEEEEEEEESTFPMLLLLLLLLVGVGQTCFHSVRAMRICFSRSPSRCVFSIPPFPFLLSSLTVEEKCLHFWKGCDGTDKDDDARSLEELLYLLLLLVVVIV